MQLTMFPPETDWQLPKMEELPDWNNFSRVGYDVETRDPSLGRKLGPGTRRDGYIVGFCLHFEDFRSFYLPIRHGNGQNLPLENVLAYMADNIRRFEGSVVGANLQYDLDYTCQEFGSEIGDKVFPNVKAFLDTQIAEPLIDENQYKFGLDAVAARHGLPEKQEDLLREVGQEFGTHNGKKGKPQGKRKALNAKADLWKLHPQYVGPYGEWDAELPCRIMRKQERIIDENDLWQIFNLETRCLPALVAMTRRGVRIDFEKMQKIEDWIIAQEDVALDLVQKQTGIKLNAEDLAQPNAVAEPLKYIGAELKRNVKNKQYNIDANVLRRLKHPVADAILTARKVNKVRRDFIHGIREHAIGDRLHCSYHQLKGEKDDGGMQGAATGRLSSSHVNIQQQPSPKDTDPETMRVEDHLSLMWRQVYIPDEGGEWACLDYSQQEPRILHHYAEITGCPGARAAAQKYRDDPKCDNHQMMADLTGLKRKVAKTIYLGKCYRMGGAKFARSLGLPTVVKTYDFGEKIGQKYETAGPEAAEILKAFKNGAPYVDKLAEIAETQGMAKGYIKTLLGRHCHFPKEMMDNPEGGPKVWTGNYLDGYKSLNKLIQGSAADQTKMALAESYEQGIAVGIQVHDELDLTIYNRKEADELAEIMRECAPLRVPSAVDIEIGPNWGEIK